MTDELQRLYEAAEQARKAYETARALLEPSLEPGPNEGDYLEVGDRMAVRQLGRVVTYRHNPATGRFDLVMVS